MRRNAFYWPGLASRAGPIVSLVCVGGLAVVGCSDTIERHSVAPIDQSAQALNDEREAVDSAQDGEGAGMLMASAAWGIAPSEDAVVAAGVLPVRLRNNIDDEVVVELGMRGAGLDQRLTYSSIGRFTLAVGEELEVLVRLEDLPMQSVGAPGQIDLVGTIF